MEVVFDTDAKEFLARCGAWLGQHAAEHNLILSVCQRAAKSETRVELRIYTLLDDDKNPVVCALIASNHNLVLSRAENLQIEPLVQRVAADKVTFPAIMGPSDVAAAFSSQWSALTGQQPVEYMDQIIYSMRNVLFPPPVDGTFRMAKPEESKLIAEWMVAFAQDSLPKAEHLTPEQALQRAQERIANRSVAVWDVGGKPVAQAGVAGTDRVVRVNMVYTPPEHRGHGYASAVVAHLSEQLLDQGRETCCLYADARNNVSNSIYRKIGYEFVGRSSLFVLEKSA